MQTYKGGAMYWEIMPYHNNNADVCVMPANSEEDHRRALEYAMERLEMAWDGLNLGQTAMVTISLRFGDMPDIDHDVF